MLRSKGLSEKVLLLGVDGLDPKFTRVMVVDVHQPQHVPADCPARPAAGENA